MRKYPYFFRSIFRHIPALIWYGYMTELKTRMKTGILAAYVKKAFSPVFSCLFFRADMIRNWSEYETDTFTENTTDMERINI